MANQNSSEHLVRFSQVGLRLSFIIGNLKMRHLILETIPKCLSFIKTCTSSFLCVDKSNLQRKIEVGLISVASMVAKVHYKSGLIIIMSVKLSKQINFKYFVLCDKKGFLFIKVILFLQHDIYLFCVPVEIRQGHMTFFRNKIELG